MRRDWTALGRVSRASLVQARLAAHHAVQWATKAARANLDAVPDDSHSSLEWNTAFAALQTQPLTAGPTAFRVAVRLPTLEVVIVRGAAAAETITLSGTTEAEAGAWIDAILKSSGLRIATSVTLPYTIPDHPVSEGGRYDVSGIASALQELAGWYGAAAETLESLQVRLRGCRPGPSPVQCWPHHFDIALLVLLEESQSQPAASVGIGLSPGDDYYSQPYFYVSPWPRLDIAGLPKAPWPGHWHTHDFVAAVATAEEILKLADRPNGLLAFAFNAFEIGRARMGR